MTQLIFQLLAIFSFAYAQVAKGSLRKLKHIYP